jgi:hypothetical protein
MDTWQGALDVTGLVPGLGEPADALNGVIWMMRGDCTAAALSFAAMVPVAGWAATAGKAGRRGLRWADEAAEFGSRHIDDVSMPTGQRVLAYGGGGVGQRFTPDQQALLALVKEVSRRGRHPLSVKDAETILDWAEETRLPGVRALPDDVANPSNWPGGKFHPHIHMPGAVSGGHVRVQPGVSPRPWLTPGSISR